jgi:hypothetical protein
VSDAYQHVSPAGASPFFTRRALLTGCRDESHAPLRDVASLQQRFPWSLSWLRRSAAAQRYYLDIRVGKDYPAPDFDGPPEQTQPMRAALGLISMIFNGERVTPAQAAQIMSQTAV